MGVRPELPSDVAKLIADFNSAESQSRNLQRSLNPKGRDLLLNNHAMSANEAMELACQEGLDVEYGRRKHSIHIVSPDGKNSMPIPVHGHGKDLTTSVAKRVVKFIKTHSLRVNSSDV